MPRPPHNETSIAHAVFLKYNGLLLVPALGQSTACVGALQGYEAIVWALPGGAQATTATLRQRASERRVAFEILAVGGKPRKHI